MFDISTHSLASMMNKLSIHTALSKQDFAAVRALPHSIELFGPGRHLVRDGDTSGDCNVIVSGFAFRYKITSQGFRQIVSIHLPGEILGFQQINLGVADHSVQTLTCCKVATIRQSALRTLASDRAAIGDALIVGSLIDASIYREWILNIGRRNARTRIAHLLCEFAARLDAQGAAPGQPYTLPMSQTHLGDALGLTAVHVSRTIKGLIKDGLVTRDQRVITFPAWDILKVEADFNSRYLHLGRQPATLVYS